MRKLLTILAVLSASALLLAPSAGAASGADAVLADCNAHATLTHKYSQTALREALNKMPADMKEYTNCPDVIQSALLGSVGGSQSGGGGAGSSSSSSFLPGWLIVVLVLLALAGLSLAAVAARRRRTEP
jgi:hypothetical protein